MSLLLDTNVVVWYLGGSSRLDPATRELIERGEGSVVVSSVSIFEMATKAAIGKLAAPADLVGAVLSAGFSALPLSFAHAAAVRDLPLLHRDPFDRLLVAQAQLEALTLITSDQQLAAYGVDCHLV